MARRNEHSREELKEMALTAADTILTEEGVAGLSTRKVAQAIGYTVGTLYLVFRNLDDLILQLNAQHLDDLFEVLDEVRRQEMPAHEVVRALGHVYMEYARLHPAQWHLLFSFQLAQGNIVPAWYQARIDRLFSLVEEQVARLNLKLDRRNLKVAATSLWAGVHGICELARGGKLSLSNAMEAEALLDSLIDNYLDGLNLNAQ